MHDDDASFRRAIERCTEEGTDIIVHASSVPNSANCDPTPNPGGIRSAINAALDSGISFISSTGNNGTGCSVSLPASYPEVVGVGAINTLTASVSYAGEPGGSGNPGTAIWSGSNSGYPLVTPYGGGSNFVTIPGVVITAPTNLGLHATSGTSGSQAYGGNQNATSGATAVMGGAAALVKEALINKGVYQLNYLHMNAVIGLFGDGAISATSKTTSYVHSTYGYGRFQMQFPTNAPSSPGEITSSRFIVGGGTLSAGQSATFYMNCGYLCSTNSTGIKAALFAEDPGRNSAWVPNFRLEIVDMCTSGYPVIQASNVYPYLWKRIRVTNRALFDGKCPGIRVTLDDNAYYQNVRFAVAGYMFGPENPYWELH